MSNYSQKFGSSMRGYFFSLFEPERAFESLEKRETLDIFSSFLGKIEVGTDNLNGELRAVH